MGRSPFFSIKDIYRPSSDTFPEIMALQVGQKVSINVESIPSQEFGIHRSISLYKYIPSTVSSQIEYVVESIDYVPRLSEIGLTAFALRDPRIPSSEHITGWVITSDGYVRETEHFSILYKLSRFHIIE